MKVIISCLSKFWAFQFAQQLDKRGYLHKLITTYYSKKSKFFRSLRNDAEEISLNKVSTNIIPALFSHGINRIPFIRSIYNWNFYALEMFDNWASNNLDTADIVIAWSACALNTIRKAKSLGAKTIVERGSTHIQFQKKILEEECGMHNIKINLVDERIVQKELLEYGECDYIITPSRFSAQTYIDYGIDSKKIIQVPFGTNLELFKQLPKEDKIFRVIYCGGISLRKGIQYLIKAFKQLKIPKSELWLVGNISQDMSCFLKNNSAENIVLKGKQPQSSLPWFYSQCDVFCIPSIEEGLPMVIPQAMACGLPVICTINSGGGDIVRDGQDGFIIPIRDIEVIKEKLLFLYENLEEREIMSDSARKRIENGYSWDDFANKVISIFFTILYQK
ncbi:MAG: hypothetical protein A3B68_07910 [Candidatus Melainabacteria bacterium RIFCSPHIGHO2_02_FULL_34_12]|nr:MAG: hypothetical protein A3B68_07910 [Candidatus Melainabacteria bacterium RIFCSPHIGHO2_02_FULL_34_12]